MVNWLFRESLPPCGAVAPHTTSILVECSDLVNMNSLYFNSLIRHKENEASVHHVIFITSMDREQLIAKAQAMNTKTDLFNLLNEVKADLMGGDKSYPFTWRQLRILCNPKNDKKRYTLFQIPKKSGGTRDICAPSGNLKWFQLCLNEIFKALYTPSPYAMGFTVGRSIVDNARMHVNQNYVFNIDLKDFFPSIDQARVWKRLQLAPFNFTKEVASVVAGVCSMQSVRYRDDLPFEQCYVLPQGAPTSPLLTNAICDTLDRRLHGLAKRFGLHYSRYADDITFSSMHNVYHSGSDFRKELQRIITDQHFTINEKKTRLCHCSSRQEVTGLTVGSKINVTRKYVKDVRALLHIWEKYGYNAAFTIFYPKYKSEKCQLHRGEPDLANVLSGKLCYLKMVKGETDPVYMKLMAQFMRLTKTPERPQPKVEQIEYLFTTCKTDFEKKLGVTLRFDKRAKDGKPFASFDFQGRHFVVAVSRNIDIAKIPANAQISLCRTTKLAEFYLSPNEPKPANIPTVTTLGYMLHRPHYGKKPQPDEPQVQLNVPDDLKELVVSLASAYPELGLRDEYGIIENANRENLLSRLVDSNFDLSILP